MDNRASVDSCRRRWMQGGSHPDTGWEALPFGVRKRERITNPLGSHQNAYAPSE